LNLQSNVRMAELKTGVSGSEPRPRAARQRVLLTGVVARTDLSASFRCAIRDRSHDGARLKLPDIDMAPDQFWLIDVAQAVAYTATVVWRRAPEVGVSFGQPMLDLKQPSGESLQRQLRALWVEVAPREHRPS
jgi:hypothetical protein